MANSEVQIDYDNEIYSCVRCTTNNDKIDHGLYCKFNNYTVEQEDYDREREHDANL